MKVISTRLVVALLALFVAGAADVWASGSGEQGASGKPVTLNFYYPVGVSGPLATVINGYTAKFNQDHPSITVNPVYTGSYTEGYTKTLAAIRGGTPPEVAILLSQNLNDLLTQDAVVPLDSFIAADPKGIDIDDFYPAFMQNAKQNGQVWSIPFQRSTPVMFYNKDAFKEVGLDPNSPPQTWADMIADAQKLTKRDASGNVTRWGVEVPSTGGVDTWLLEALTIEAGGLLYDANNPCCAIKLNSQQAIDGLQLLRDLGTKYNVSPTGVVNWGTAPNDFVAGKVAMIYHSTGSLAYVRSNAQFAWGTAFLPKNQQFGVPTGGGDFYLFKGTPSDRQKAAWTFIEWMTSTNQLAQWSIDSGYVAPRASSWDTDLMKSYVAKYPQALTARDQVQFAHAELPVRNILQVKQEIDNALQTALTTSQPLDSIVAASQSKIDAILK